MIIIHVSSQHFRCNVDIRYNVNFVSMVPSKMGFHYVQSGKRVESMTGETLPGVAWAQWAVAVLCVAQDGDGHICLVTAALV